MTSTHFGDIAAGPAVLGDVLPGAKTRDALLIVGGVALTALLAQVSVPMSPVPITGQTLAVGVVGASLGTRRGTLAMVLYVLAGFALPVYAGGASGAHVLWGPSGGYLFGFIVAAALIGWMSERGSDRRVARALLAFVAAQAVIFVPGLIELHVVTGYDWSTTIHDGFTVFIIGGLVKAAVGSVVLPSAWSLVRRLEGRS